MNISVNQYEYDITIAYQCFQVLFLTEIQHYSLKNKIHYPSLYQKITKVNKHTRLYYRRVCFIPHERAVRPPPQDSEKSEEDRWGMKKTPTYGSFTLSSTYEAFFNSICASTGS